MSTEKKCLLQSATMADITPEIEERMTQYALLVFDQYRRDMGWGAAGSYIPGSWLWKRAAANARFRNDFSDRLFLPKELGGELYRLSNLSLNMPRRFIEDHHARIAADLESKGYFAMVPDTEEDAHPGIKLFEEYLQAKAQRCKLADTLKDGVELRALIQGEQIVKVIKNRKITKRWVETEILMVDGKPLKDSAGNPVTVLDTWEPDPMHPGMDRLVRDHAVWKMTGVELPRSPKKHKVLAITSDITGADVQPVYFADWVCDLTAPSIDASVLKGQCFAMAWDDLMDLYGQGSKLTPAGEEYGRQNGAGMAELPDTTDALQPVNGEAPPSRLPDQGALPRRKLCELWFRYDINGDGRREDICATFDYTSRCPVRYEIAQEVLESEERSHPYLEDRVYPVNYRWYGMGLYERHNDLSESVDRDLNRIEVEKLSSGKIVAVKRDAFEETKAGRRMTLRGPVLYHLDGQNTMEEAVGVSVIKPELEGIQASLNLTLQTLMSEGGGVTPGETEGAGLEGANTATGLQILQEGKNQKIGKRQDEINKGVLAIMQLYAQIEADAFDEPFARRLFKRRMVEMPPELQDEEPMVESGAMEPGTFPAENAEGDVQIVPGGGLQMEPMVDELGQPIMVPVMVPAVDLLKEWLATVQKDELQNAVRLVLSRSRSTQVVRTNDNILKLVEKWVTYPPYLQEVLKPVFTEMLAALDVSDPGRFLPITPMAPMPMDGSAGGPMPSGSAAPSSASADSIPTGRPEPSDQTPAL